MTYTIITNQSEWDDMISVSGKKMIYIISDQCDGRRHGSDDWATNYEGTNVDYLYLVTFEELSRSLYDILSPLGIGELPAILYYNNSILEWGRGAMTPDMENHVVEDMDYKIGDDVIAYDTGNDQLVVMSGKSVNHITMPDRYVTNGDVMIGINQGYVHAVCPTYASSTDIGSSPVHYRIDIPAANGLTLNSGYFTYEACISSASVNTSGSASWNAGDTLESIVAQIPTITRFTTGLTADNQAIYMTCTGTGSLNTVTFTDSQGCTLIDCTTLAIFDESRTIRDGDLYDSTLPIINNNHKNWPGKSFPDMMNSYIVNKGWPRLPLYSTSSSKCFGENGQNYGPYTIANLQQAYGYQKSSGYNVFRSDGVNGASLNTSYRSVMRESVFNSSVNENADPSTDQGKMYAYYSALRTGSSGYEDLHNKLIEKFNTYLTDSNTLYMWYLAAHSTNLDASGCIISYNRNIGVYYTHILGRVFTVDYNYQYIPAYPYAYDVLRYEETTPIYQYINDNINNSQYYKHGNIELYGLGETWDIGYILNDIMMPKINTRQSDVFLGLENHQNINRDSHMGSFSLYNNYNIWIYYKNAGHLTYSFGRKQYFHPRPVIVYQI